MQNFTVKSFDQQVEAFTRGFVNVITALAPLVLILVILGIACANAFVEYLYQLAIFKDYALYPAILVAGLRFASGMGGISLIKAARYLPGIFFVVISFLLTWYAWHHVETISGSIAPDAAIQAAFTISMILWGGFIGELMIAAYMFASGQMEPTPTPQEDEAWTPPADEQSDKQPEDQDAQKMADFWRKEYLRLVDDHLQIQGRKVMTDEEREQVGKDPDLDHFSGNGQRRQ